MKMSDNCVLADSGDADRAIMSSNYSDTPINASVEPVYSTHSNFCSYPFSSLWVTSVADGSSVCASVE